MRKKVVFSFLCCMIILNGCSNDEIDDIDEDVMQKIESEEQTEYAQSFDDYNFDNTAENDLNVMDYHYDIKQIYYYGNDEDYISDDEQFWVKTGYTFDNGNSFVEYVLTDTSAHIYKILDSESLNMDHNLDIIVSLPNGGTAFGYTKDDGYGTKYWHDYKVFAAVDSDLNDISNQLFGEDETIWNIQKDDNGISIFTVKTIETYSYQDMIINVYDENMNYKFSFSKSELSDRYGLKNMSLEKLYLTPIGGNIYYMMPNGSNDTLFIDTTREKVFVMDTTKRTNHSVYSSDGNYILCTGLGSLLIDIDSESTIFDTLHIKFGEYETFMGSGSYTIDEFSEIREGRFYGKSYYGNDYYGLFDYGASLIKILDYDGSKLSNYSMFYNGHAMLELENSGGTTFVTVIDKDGNWLFEPISGNLGGRAYYFENIDCFLIFSNDGTGGYLLNSQGIQQQLPSISNGSFFHLTTINGESRIIYLDYKQEMFLYTDEVVSVNEYTSEHNSYEEKNNTSKEKSSVVLADTYYQCVNNFPLEVDDTIWEMSEKEFEQYTGIVLPERKSANAQYYYIMDLPKLKLEGGNYTIESADGDIIFDKEKGLIAIGFTVWVDDMSDENIEDNLQNWLYQNENSITVDDQYFIWEKNNHYTLFACGENHAELIYLNKAYINTASDAELQELLRETYVDIFKIIRSNIS